MSNNTTRPATAPLPGAGRDAGVVALATILTQLLSPWAGRHGVDPGTVAVAIPTLFFGAFTFFRKQWSNKVHKG